MDRGNLRVGERSVTLHAKTDATRRCSLAYPQVERMKLYSWNPVQLRPPSSNQGQATTPDAASRARLAGDGEKKIRVNTSKHEASPISSPQSVVAKHRLNGAAEELHTCSVQV